MNNLTNTHQLIQRQQNYVMERKLISIHSEDRDIKKWPDSNHFEVILPEPMINVQSMRLLDILVPVNFYSFSSTQQNTKMFFSVIPNKDISGAYPTLYTDLSNSVITPYEITIQDGFYAANELAVELENRMNTRLQTIDTSFNYNYFVCYYDNVSQKIWFGNNRGDGFNLEFQLQSTYVLPNNENVIDWNNYTKWGLGFYLGYDKLKYTATASTSDIFFYYTTATDSAGVKQHLPYKWLNTADSTTGIVYYSKPPYVLKINGDKCIYLELNKYNSYDELYPFSQATTNVLNNDFGGKVNSAFAKIMITTTPFNESFESSNGFLNNMSFFNPPMERLSKLEFKFRYHNGRLVDFQKYPFHFTVEVNSLRNEIQKSYNVRTPTSF